LNFPIPLRDAQGTVTFPSIDQTLSTTAIERRFRLSRTGEAGAVFLRRVGDPQRLAASFCRQT